MIVITTPTGQIGSRVLEQVVRSAADEVRVIVRDPARLPASLRQRVDVVTGSHDDSGVVAEALSGAGSVFWLIPPNPRAPSVQDHVIDFVRPLCTAINGNGVERVVAVSTVGRGITRNAGVVSATYAMDDLIESTGVHYRSLCPPAFMENLLSQVEAIRSKGTFFAPLSADRRFLTCSTRDIAATAAELLLDDSWTGQDSVPIVGPDLLSYTEMAQIMTEVLQRPVHYQQISDEAFRATLRRAGVSEAWAEGGAAIMAATDRGTYATATGAPAPTAPTGFRRWCEEVLKPAVDS
jgi:uncharacterized protein YbjT (DUF2867 family)